MHFTERKRILCVEDDRKFNQLLSACLTEYRLINVVTATDALQLAQAEDFNLFLLDAASLDDAALDLCRELRAIAPATPLLLCSNGTREADRQAGKAAGANIYLTKPIDPDALRQVVEFLCPAKPPKNPN